MEWGGLSGVSKIERVVLVVDPNAMQRRSISILLRRSGFTVLQAKDEQEALVLANDSQLTIDLLLTAIRLPGTNGFSLADELVVQRPNLKTVYSSAEPYFTLSRTYGDLLPPNSFIQMPVSPQTLVKTLSEALGLQPS